jgi:alpha-1,4-digalacturonate transport system substrate-binding protein
MKRTKNPKDVGRFLDYLASEPVYAEYMARTENIPAHAGVAKKGVDYKISPQSKAALATFVADVPQLSPVAYRIQGYKLNRAIFNPTAARLGQAIAGEMSLDDALKRISADIDEQVKAAAK